ncbi:MAG: helix-turn-helix transcriptional regulator [Clostridia bacterium]|nr:helix-turn-helix transcriptional regulator [Clostridia bacterium]
MTTGEIIKNLRIERKMTQRQLADLLGYSDLSSISKIEKGVKDLPANKFSAVAEIFGVSVDALLNQTSTSTNEKIVLMNVSSLYGKPAVDALLLFDKLNETGQHKALDTLDDLVEIEKYKK